MHVHAYTALRQPTEHVHVHLGAIFWVSSDYLGTTDYGHSTPYFTRGDCKAVKRITASRDTLSLVSLAGHSI